MAQASSKTGTQQGSIIGAWLQGIYLQHSPSQTPDQSTLSYQQLLSQLSAKRPKQTINNALNDHDIKILYQQLQQQLGSQALTLNPYTINSVAGLVKYYFGLDVEVERVVEALSC